MFSIAPHQPTLEELSLFEMTEEESGEMELPDEPSQKPAFSVGDRVEVIGGELQNLTGAVASCGAKEDARK